MTEVSVILPVFNVEPYLTQCMDSIVNQSFEDIEIICIDDGSTDESLMILKKYRDSDPRITIISTENRGAGAARNYGMKIARGKYFLFLDSDDFFEKNMIDQAYNMCKKYEADVTVFRSNTFDHEKKTFVETPWTIRSKTLPSKCFSIGDIKQDIFKQFVGWAWDKLYSASFVKSHNLSFQEQRTSNDMLFVFSSIVLAKKICILDETLAHHRRGVRSLATTREQSWTCFHDALIALRKNLLDWNLFDKYYIDFVNYCLHASLWNLNSLHSDIQEELFYKLKEEWFREFEIEGKEKSFFYNEYEYGQYISIMDKKYEDWKAGSNL